MRVDLRTKSISRESLYILK